MVTNNAGNIGTGAVGTVLTGNGVGVPATFQGPSSTAGASSFLAYASAAQTFTALTGTPVKVVYDTVSYDVASDYNNGTYVYTVPTTGKVYLVNATLRYNVPVIVSLTDGFILYIKLNGTVVASQQMGVYVVGGYPTSVSVEWQGQLTASDTLEVDFSTSGSTLTVVSAGGSAPVVSWFSVTQVS